MTKLLRSFGHQQEIRKPGNHALRNLRTLECGIPKTRRGLRGTDHCIETVIPLETMKKHAHPWESFLPELISCPECHQVVLTVGVQRSWNGICLLVYAHPHITVIPHRMTPTQRLMPENRQTQPGCAEYTLTRLFSVVSRWCRVSNNRAQARSCQLPWPDTSLPALPTENQLPASSTHGSSWHSL